jgi:hypothetical protein
MLNKMAGLTWLVAVRLGLLSNHKVVQALLLGGGC